MISTGMAKDWKLLRQLRGEVNKTLEKARQDKVIGSSLEAKLLLLIDTNEQQVSVQNRNQMSEEEVLILLLFMLEYETEPRNDGMPLSMFFGVSYEQTELVDFIEELGPYSMQVGPGLHIGVKKADGLKCDRCWNYSIHVGESEEHPTLCPRCVLALQGKY